MDISDLNNDAKIALVQSGVEQLIERNNKLQQQNDELRKALEEIQDVENGTYKGTTTYCKKVAREALSNNPKL